MSRTIRRGLAAATLALIAGSAGMAHAIGLTTTEYLNHFNVIVLGDATSMDQEVEGRLYVGGNMTGTTLQLNFGGAGAASAPTSPFAELVVGGNVTMGSSVTFANQARGVILGNGSFGAEGPSTLGGGTRVDVGGTHTGLDNNGLVTDGVPGLADRLPMGIGAQLLGVSAHLATLAATETAFIDPNLIRFTVTAPNAVFRVNASDFGPNTAVELAFGALVETVIIDVVNDNGSSLGNPLTFRNFVASDVDEAAKVLWNFVDTPSIVTTSQFFGTLFAPGALVENRNSIDGTLVAGTLIQNGENHIAPFSGDLEPFLPGNPPAATVPLPAGAPLLLAALGLMGLLRRRRG